MDKLSVEDIKKHISENREDAQIDLSDDYPSYINIVKGRYWIISLVIKLDAILQDHTYLENLTDILKFSFNVSVVFDNCMSVDDKNNFIVQRLIQDEEKSYIEDVVYQHEAYVQQIFDILHKNKLGSNTVASNGSQVSTP